MLVRGVLILIFRPFKVGDIITAAGVTGRKVELERNGLSIPFPQRDVHLIQQPAAEQAR